jgi:predicted SAM-dependent methyltransferase
MDEQRLKINIGCGLNAASGWVNIDSSLNAWLAKWGWKTRIPYPKNIYIRDVRKGLPFPNNSAEVIYCSHFLEHLTKDDAVSFIKECQRVLITAGVIRIIVPDLAQYAEEYVKRIKEQKQGVLISEQPAEKFLEDLCIFEKSSARESGVSRIYKKLYNKNIHKFMYDEYSLTALLKEYGFSDIYRKSCYESLIKDVEKLDNPERFNNAICLESRKP